MCNDKKKCSRCGEPIKKKPYRVDLVSLDERGRANEITDWDLCYTCRRALGRFMRNEL